MPNRDVELEITLTSDTTPLESKTIHFYHKVAGGPTWAEDAPAVDTDVNGIADKTVSVTVPASYDFKAEFEGDEDYDSSTTTSMNFKVKGKTTLNLTVTPV